MNIKISKHFITGNPIGNLHRKRHSLILVEDQEGKYLFGEKANFYPDGIVRLIGGGLDESEDSEIGAMRELAEETGLHLEVGQLKEVAQIPISASTTQGEKNITVYLYYYKLQKGENLIFADDISSICALSREEFKNLIIRFEELNGIHELGKDTFDWKDYGQIYSYIHQIAYEFIV